MLAFKIRDIKMCMVFIFIRASVAKFFFYQIVEVNKLFDMLLIVAVSI